MPEAKPKELTMKALKLILAIVILMPAVSFADGGSLDHSMCGALTQMFNSLPKSPAQLEREFLALQSELDESKLPELKKLESQLHEARELDRAATEACGN
jgi:hypothetical protein